VGPSSGRPRYCRARRQQDSSGHFARAKVARIRTIFAAFEYKPGSSEEQGR
jgi:hypothetical protein